MKVRWGKLLSGVAAAVLGLLLLYFVLVGVLTLTGRSSVRSVRHIEGETPAVIDSTFARVAALLVGTSLAAGHTIDILCSGDETYPRLWSDLRAARHSINIQMYYAAPGAVLDTLQRLLRERARAGVTTRFLYDAFGADVPDVMRDSLRSAGVVAHEFRPIRWYSAHKSHNRAHVRAVIIDGRIGYTGGFGFDDKWLGDGRRRGWRDTNVRFEGPAVAQLQSAFAASWAETTRELLIDELAQPEPATHAGALAGLLHTTPRVGSTAGDRLFALSIGSARHRLFLANSYFVPSGSQVDLLTRAAQHGVDVRLLLPGPDTDVRVTRRAARGNYEKLLRGGVRIWEYRPVMMHAKAFTVDGSWASIGSMNFDELSLSHNEETNLLIFDREQVARLDSIFAVDLAQSQEIRLEEFLRRPWHERLRERFAIAVRDFL